MRIGSCKNIKECIRQEEGK